MILCKRLQIAIGDRFAVHANSFASKPSNFSLTRRLNSELVTRITAIMNRNTKDISTDLLLRVLYALGYTAKITFKTAA